MLAAAGTALAVAAVALAAPGDPQKRFNARDQASARAMVLTAADLPASGWKRKATDFSQANPACVVKSYSLSALTATGEAGSTYVIGGGVVAVESDGHVFRTPVEAARAFAIASKAGLGRCLGAYFAAGLRKSANGATVRLAKVEPVVLKGLATPARGFRVTLAVTSGKTTIPIEIVQVNLVHGRGAGTLGVITTGTSWPQASLRSLVARAALRLKRA